MTELEPVSRLSRDIRAAASGMSVDEARFLVDRYYQLQDERIATRNQERAAGTVENEPHAVLSYLANQFEVLEGQIKGALDKWTASHPVGVKMRSVRGVGPVIAAGILSRVDIERCPHVSSLWSYAGLAPGQKRKRGEKSNWNPGLKRICWLLGESFVKAGGQYGDTYRSRKAYETARNEAGDYADKASTELTTKTYGKETEAYKALSAGRLPLAALHARAKRYDVKMFLSDLWVEWRTAENLPLTDPWAFAYGGHDTAGMVRREWD